MIDIKLCEDIHIKVPKGFNQKIEDAGKALYLTKSGWIRKIINEALEKELKKR